MSLSGRHAMGFSSVQDEQADAAILHIRDAHRYLQLHGLFHSPTEAEDAVNHPGCGSEVPQPPVQADPGGSACTGGRLATPAHLGFDLSAAAVARWPAAYLKANLGFDEVGVDGRALICLLYTSPSPRD